MSNTSHWALSDIHGHSVLLDSLISRIAYRNSNFRLHLLGDYIDRGPDSLGVLRTLSQLRQDGLIENMLIGNHDYKLFRYLRDYLKGDTPRVTLNHGALETVEQLMQCERAELEGIYMLLAGMPTHAEVDNMKLVHAYYSLSSVGKPLNKSQTMFIGIVEPGVLSENGLPSRVKWWETYDGRNGKIIFGHFHLGYQDYGHSVSIDPNVCETGRLLAYNLHTGEVIYSDTY